MRESNETPSASQGHKNGGGNHGHHSAPYGHEGHDHHAMMVADFRRRFFISLAATLLILLLSPVIQDWLGIDWQPPGARWLLVGLSAFVYLYGGWPFLTGIVRELRQGKPGMMTLVAMAITVAFVFSLAVAFGVTAGMLLFWETATLIDLMLVGHWIEMRSVMGAGRALEELARLMPSEAHLINDDGSTSEVSLARLHKGDRVRIKSGEKIPADGIVTEGSSAVNESLLTGESEPVSKSEGSEVIAGSVNGTGTLVVEIRKTGADSYLNQVVTLVRNAQQTRSRTQNLADRAAFFLTIIALGTGVATFVAWYAFAGAELAYAVERTVTVMVIACPHALGLAIPLVVAVSTSISAGNGLLIRDRTAFEQARNIDTIVFDKTGTLTEGRFGVTDIVMFTDGAEDELLRLAAAVESFSEHPIAGGILRSARERNLSPLDAKDFEALTGKGVQARVQGREIQVLSPAGAERAGVQVQRAATLLDQGKTVVFVVRDGEGLGAVALADRIRASSADAVKTLHEMGIDVVMLTGDRRQVADWVADELSLDRVIAEVLPDQKAETIRNLQEEGRTVAMTGDGVNDAPALATADVGIAIGAGTDVAVETADIVLVDSDPRDAVQIIRLARATYRKMVQNLWYSAGYNIVAIPLAAGAVAWAGLVLNPAVGAVLMSLSTVVVAINARLLRL